MKKVGILFAMQEELHALLTLITITKKYEIFDLTFYEGNLGNIECILVECGIGKVNAARTAQIVIDNMKVDYIFNIGVAGGVKETLSIGDIVLAESLVQHDFDITAFHHEKGYIPKVGTYINTDTYLLKLAEETLKDEKDLHIVTGIIASGDIFCTEEKMSQKIATKFSASCVEMEGASIAQVCYLSHIPFLILRSISDVPNNNNVITYEEFLKTSAKKVALAMNKLLIRLENE